MSIPSQNYDCYSEVRSLETPLAGGFKYAAKAQIYKMGSGSTENLGDALGETWGKTAEEASNMMNEKIKGWLIATEGVQEM
jgi:hypothetical protein